MAKKNECLLLECTKEPLYRQSSCTLIEKCHQGLVKCNFALYTPLALHSFAQELVATNINVGGGGGGGGGSYMHFRGKPLFLE